jgi:hypothetical protein
MLLQRACKIPTTVLFTPFSYQYSAIANQSDADALAPFIPPWVDVLLPAATATVQQMAQVSTARGRG